MITPKMLAVSRANRISDNLLRTRISRGWDKERAITESTKKERAYWMEVAKKNGIKRMTFNNRLYQLGYTYEMAATKPLKGQGKVGNPMYEKKKYTFFFCKDCEIDFFVSKAGKHIFCPNCGESIYTEKKTTIWIERPFNYKRRWTEDEDSLLLNGIKQGYNRQEIAEELDRTIGSVRKRYQALVNKGITL